MIHPKGKELDKQMNVTEFVGSSSWRNSMHQNWVSVVSQITEGHRLWIIGRRSSQTLVNLFHEWGMLGIQIKFSIQSPSVIPCSFNFTTADVTRATIPHVMSYETHFTVLFRWGCVPQFTCYDRGMFLRFNLIRLRPPIYFLWGMFLSLFFCLLLRARSRTVHRGIQSVVVKKRKGLRFHCLLTQGRVCFLKLKEPNISV